MRFALISDIHSNLPALEAVLASAEAEGCERILCLGDVVGYGAYPNEVIERLADLHVPTILGNHDAAAVGRLGREVMNNNARAAIEWTVSVLTPASRSFLTGLPLARSEGEALFVHASPLNPDEWCYIFNVSEAQAAFRAFSESICFYGHTHFPTQFTSSADGKRLINVGSVGQPRDRDPRACYGIYDQKNRAFRWNRVDYSIEVAARAIIDAGLPPYLAERLSRGV